MTISTIFLFFFTLAVACLFYTFFTIQRILGMINTKYHKR